MRFSLKRSLGSAFPKLNVEGSNPVARFGWRWRAAEQRVGSPLALQSGWHESMAQRTHGGAAEFWEFSRFSCFSDGQSG